MASRGRFSLGVIDCSIRCLCPRHIGTEIFQSQSKLIVIEPLRSPPKLRALQALDDEPEPLHLGPRRSKLRVILGNFGGKLAHQAMQCIDVHWQRGEIEIHARESNIDRQRPPRQLPS